MSAGRVNGELAVSRSLGASLHASRESTAKPPGGLVRRWCVRRPFVAGDFDYKTRRHDLPPGAQPVRELGAQPARELGARQQTQLSERRCRLRRGSRMVPSQQMVPSCIMIVATIHAIVGSTAALVAG